MDSTIAKGMRILELIAGNDGPMSVGDVAEASGLGKSNVHRTLQTFVELGYLRQSGNKGSYAPTTRLWELGMHVMARLDFVQVARPHLIRLCDETGESALLSILDGNEAIYVDRIMSRHSITVFNPIGARVPAWCNASGRVLLACTEVDPIAHAGHLHVYTANTIHEPAALASEFARIRANGFSLTCEEWRPGVYGLAAPIRDRNGNPVGSIGVTGPTSQLNAERVGELSASVIGHASAISAELGLR